MRIYLNPNCDYGKGRSKWQRIEKPLRRSVGNFKLEEIQSPGKLHLQVKNAIEEGERIFVAAGGDGTVNLLLNALMNSSASKQEFVLGAIGLGSSNDFHKPFRPETFIEGIPTRINSRNTIPTDVIRVRHTEDQNQILARYCIINASIGITAQANALYNSRQPFIVRIKRISHEAAVIVSALTTIITYRNIPCTLGLENSKSRHFSITNLGVLKNPHFAGGLCYDTSIRPDDGNFYVNLASDMTRREAIGTMVRLYRRKFKGQPKTYSWVKTKLMVRSAFPFALEMDGEVVRANHAEFKLIPKAMRCCR
jgi:diacylglycerol kinase (ATP)